MERRAEVTVTERREPGELRVPEALTSWSPEDVFLASDEGGRVASALGPGLPLAWTLSLHPGQEVPGLPSGLWVPAFAPSAFLQHKEARAGASLRPPLPQHLGRACDCRCCTPRSPAPGAVIAGPRGLETTNDSPLTGCWLPPACQPVPLHAADNHVRPGSPPARAGVI